MTAILFIRYAEARFASVAIASGADVASVSEALGHSDKAVMPRMQARADKESVSRASRIFREAVKKAGQSETLFGKAIFHALCRRSGEIYPVRRRFLSVLIRTNHSQIFFK